MISDNEAFYLSKEEPAQGCLLALRRIILEQDHNLLETRKYGMPCFCYQEKVFCYLWTDKKTQQPYVLMAEGETAESFGLGKGDRTKMKIYRINAFEDLPLAELKEVLGEGLKLYYEGIIAVK